MQAAEIGATYKIPPPKRTNKRTKKKQFIRSHTNQRVHLKMCKYKKQGVKIQLLHRVS